jgi:hypothetical protein
MLRRIRMHFLNLEYLWNVRCDLCLMKKKTAEILRRISMYCLNLMYLWNVRCDLCLTKKSRQQKCWAECQCTFWTFKVPVKGTLWPLSDKEADRKMLRRIISVLSEHRVPVKCTLWPLSDKEADSKNVEQNINVLSELLKYLWNVRCDLCLKKKKTAKMLRRISMYCLNF